jgi:hypothetical protein
LYNEIKGLESLVLQYENQVGRLPGDCSRDGIVDYNLATLGTIGTDPAAYSVVEAGTTLRAAKYDFTNGPLVVYAAGSTNPGSNLVACAENAGAISDEDQANRWLNDLKRANLIPTSSSNRVVAKHTANDFIFFGKFVATATQLDTMNAFTIANVPVGTARQVLMKINGTEDVTKGQMRVLTEAGLLEAKTVFDARVPTSIVSLIYFYRDQPQPNAL